MSEQRALTWSGKWHIVNPDHPDAGRYTIARCGAYLRRDDDPQYPEHLKRIKDGTKKSMGICKLCTRSSGIKTVTLELPTPDDDGEWYEDSWYVNFDPDMASHQKLRVNVPQMHMAPGAAKRFAAALLAAADAAERV